MKRIGNGLYDMKLGDRTVTIMRYTKRSGATFSGWIVRADWDSYLVSDPIATLDQAKACAVLMLSADY